MQVCQAGQTLAQRRVIVCDVHVSGAFTMKYLLFVPHFNLLYSQFPLSTKVFTLPTHHIHTFKTIY